MVNLMETLGHACAAGLHLRRENELMLLQMKGFGLGTGQALLRIPKGRNASRDGLVKLD